MKIELLRDCKDLKELKSLYRKLAFQFHPDKATGSLEKMQQLNAEYEYLSNHFEESKDNMSMFIDTIDKIINLSDITIEIVGNWIWVSGDTKQYKDILKGLKFFWNRQRELWQKKPNDDKFKTRNSKCSDGEIKEKYGCTTIKGNPKPPFKPTLA